jgi:hypothetical protein
MVEKEEEEKRGGCERELLSTIYLTTTLLVKWEWAGKEEGVRQTRSIKRGWSQLSRGSPMGSTPHSNAMLCYSNVY